MLCEQVRYDELRRMQLLTMNAEPFWASISTEYLRAELERRTEIAEKPKCGSGSKGSYNTSAHVFALILILVLSTIGWLPALRVYMIAD